MSRIKKYPQMAFLVVAAPWLAGSMARADVVTDWNVKAGDIIIEAKLGKPPANRVLAIIHTSVYEATNAITRRYPASGLTLEGAPGASVEAAIATANHATLTKLVPSQQTAIDTAYHAALAMITDGPAKTAGLAVGEKAAAAILAVRADDGASTGETYRPHTTQRGQRNGLPGQGELNSDAVHFPCSVIQHANFSLRMLPKIHDAS